MKPIVAVVLLLLLASAAQAEVHTVTTMRTGDDSAPFAFSPEELIIQVGDTVRWVNGDGAFHTTTSQDGIWDGTLGSEGATFEHTFGEAGTFAYRCNPHASFMAGTIVVEGGPAAEGGPSEGAPGPGLPFVMLALLALVRPQ